MSGGFQHDIAGGQGKLIATQLQSPNFSLADRTGWAIMKNGDAYFFNVTAEGAVTSNTVVVSGAGDGIFIYDGTPMPGSLVVSITSEPGSDQFGNPYPGPGISISVPGPGGSKNEIQIRPDKSAMLIYAAG